MTKQVHRNTNAGSRKPARPASTPAGDVPSHRRWLDHIGGESLHGSGFENEAPVLDFAEKLSIRFPAGPQGGSL